MKVGGRCDISPEVLEANIDDVVAWTFDGRRQHDVHLLGRPSSDGAGDNDRKGKRRGKKSQDICVDVELDAATLAGEVVKPRSVIDEIKTSTSLAFSAEMLIHTTPLIQQ